MPRIAGVGYLQAVRILERLGYRIVRQSKHAVMSNGEITVTIPRHNPVNAYTMGAIARDVGLSPAEFRELM